MSPPPQDVPGLRKFERLGIIIGAMKSGTTSLFHALRQHPQIAACSEKETDFFKTEQSAAAGLDAYEALWTYDRAKHKIAFEASPNYSKYPENKGVAERLAATPYDLRLVYVMRHPIQRYASHYIHALSRDYGVRDIHREVDPNALSASSYCTQLNVFAAHIPRAKILLIKFEDLTTRPQEQLVRITDHFGVARGTWSGLPRFHATARDHLGRAIERLKSESAKPDGRYGPPVLRPDGEVDLRQTFLPPAMVQSLYRALKDDMRRLNDEWGVDVRPWGF